jgi:hypothetical protein
LIEGRLEWEAINPTDRVLEQLGLVKDRVASAEGQGYYFAQFVVEDRDQATRVLGDLLKRQLVPNTFCEALWSYSSVTVDGAANLIKRITRSPDDNSARCWLNVMSRGGLLRFTRPGLRVLYNPRELVAQPDESASERTTGHLLDPKRPYGNLLALKELLRGARTSIRWYEQHQTAKVLEVLYREIDGKSVSTIRLLSGPAAIDSATKDEFKRFRNDMADERNVDAHWRVLSKDDARSIHGRFFITQDYSRHIPPLNLILMGTVDEILPSDVNEKDFDAWWAFGTDIANVQPIPK